MTHPLTTKMTTGATLAVTGDAIAQWSAASLSTSSNNDVNNEDKNNDNNKIQFDYDIQRAISFAAFDACYRALQHVSFPVIVRECQGQYIGGMAAGLVHFMGVNSVNVEDMRLGFAAMEQTLASQLGIVPFLYYPVFYTLTALIQGLTTSQAVDRAKETFIPLMKRNLLFWIPVQFVQFGYIEEGLQIPFLSVCGLAWTIILSLMAGSTKSYGKSTAPTKSSSLSLEREQVGERDQLIEKQGEEHIITNYCVNGNEPNCEVDPDHLFPGVFEMEEDGKDPVIVTRDIDAAIKKERGGERVGEDQAVLR